MHGGVTGKAGDSLPMSIVRIGDISALLKPQEKDTLDMDSPELQYLKATHEKNKKFYAHALIELADLSASVAVLTEMVKADIALRNNYDPKGFEAELRKKQLEFQKAFREAAATRLREDGLESESQTN
jgi:hypothetical protein